MPLPRRLPRLLLPLLLLGAGLLPGPVLAQRTTIEAYAEQVRAAEQARRLRDRIGLARALEAMRAARPQDPRPRRALAALAAGDGEVERTATLLESLARQGLTEDLALDPAFERVREQPRLRELFDRLRDNGRPQGEGEPVLELPHRDFFPEGLAWDGRRQRWLLGSVAQREIVAVGPDAAPVVFAREGLWSVQGLAIEPGRDRLWVVSSAYPEMRDHDPLLAGRAALLAYALEDGRLLARIEAPADGELHAFNDLWVDAQGGVFISDSGAGRLWRLDPGARQLRALTPARSLDGPQGLAPSADGSALLVADYGRGLQRVALESGQIEPVQVPDTLTTIGIDGLVPHRGDLLAIQNGVQPRRVLRLRLDASGRQVTAHEVLAQALREFDEPTLGVVVEERLVLVANSPWRYARGSAGLDPQAPLRPPLLLALRLMPPRGGRP